MTFVFFLALPRDRYTESPGVEEGRAAEPLSLDHFVDDCQLGRLRAGAGILSALQRCIGNYYRAIPLC